MNSEEPMYDRRYILMDFQTSSATATAPSVQQEIQQPLSQTELEAWSKKNSLFCTWSRLWAYGTVRSAGVDPMAMCIIRIGRHV